MRFFAAIVIILSPAGAMAAPFCVAVPGSAPRCIYYDVGDCQREAALQNGACDANPQVTRPPTSRVGEYCLVTSGGSTQCGYADDASCTQEARIRNGICAQVARTQPDAVTDPYDPNARR
jgi:hypothetical protein